MFFGIHLEELLAGPPIHPKQIGNLKKNVMDELQQFITQSAIGPYSPWVRNLVFTIFLSIVLTLMGMLAVLLLHGHHMNVSFGY